MTSDNWMVIDSLESGVTYEMKVVAVTDSEHKTASEPRGVMAGSIRGKTLCNSFCMTVS